MGSASSIQAIKGENAWHSMFYQKGQYALTFQNGWDPDTSDEYSLSVGISTSWCSDHGPIQCDWAVYDMHGRLVGNLRNDENSSRMLTITINSPDSHVSYTPNPNDVHLNIREDFVVRVPGYANGKCTTNDIGYMRIETVHGKTMYEVLRTSAGKCKQASCHH